MSAQRISPETVTRLVFDRDNGAVVNCDIGTENVRATLARPSGEPGRVFIAVNGAHAMTRVAVVHDPKESPYGETVAVVHGLDQYDVLAAIVGAL